MHCSVPVPCAHPWRSGHGTAPALSVHGSVSGHGTGRVKGRVSGRAGAERPQPPSAAAAPMAAGSRAVSVLRRTLTLSPPRKPPRAAGQRRGQQQQRCGAPPAPPPAVAPRFQPTAPGPLCPQDSLGCGLRTCYRYLNQTSRSFAAVIQALDGELR